MKIVIADPKEGKCYQIELDATKSKPLYNMKLGNELDGSLLGLTGYKLLITGGTDRDGFPMRRDVHGTERKRILLSEPPGFKPSEKGERMKKTIRGETIAEDIAQLNVKVKDYGPKGIVDTLGLKIEEKKKEAPKEEEKKAKKK
jgi:small subunit ribosomal protein S6e